MTTISQFLRAALDDSQRGSARYAQSLSSVFGSSLNDPRLVRVAVPGFVGASIAVSLFLRLVNFAGLRVEQLPLFVFALATLAGICLLLPLAYGLRSAITKSRGALLPIIASCGALVVASLVSVGILFLAEWITAWDAQQLREFAKLWSSGTLTVGLTALSLGSPMCWPVVAGWWWIVGGPLYRALVRPLVNAPLTFESPDRQPDVTARAALVQRVSLLVIFGLASAAVFARLYNLRSTAYLIWGDRDLSRASSVFQHWWGTGAELFEGTGAGIPGGLQYYFMYPILQVFPSLTGIHATAMVLEAISGCVLVAVLWRYCGRWAAAIAVALYFGSEVVEVAMHQLWNPIWFMSTVLVAYAALIAFVCEGKQRWALLCATMLGMASQLHLSGILLALAFAVPSLLYQPRASFKAIPLSLIILAMLYSPFIAEEIRTDSFNTRSMGNQPSIQESAGLRSNRWWTRTRVRTDMFVKVATEGLQYPHREEMRNKTAVRRAGWRLHAWFFLPAVFGIVQWLRRKTREPDVARPFHTRALGTSALVLAFIMLYYGWDQGLRLSRSESRYFLLAIPGLCILVGVGWSGILGTLRARGRSRTVAVVQVASIVAVLVPMVAPWAKAYSWIGKDSTTTRSTYGWHESRRDEIMAMTGWSGPEIAGRVAGPIQRSGVINPRGYLPALDRESRGLGVEYMFAWQYLLHPNGEDFQGSQAPPCALWLRLQSPEDQDRTAEDLVHEFAMRPVADLRILDEATWAEDRFIVYDTSDAFCHCTVSNRYVLTTTEKATLPLYSVVPPGSALKLSEEPGAQRYFAVLQYLHHRVLRGNLIFDFEMNDAEQFVTLHSNQLRGYAQVEGYFNRATLQAPQLIWKNLDTGDEHVTTLWEEFVGWGGIYTPLRMPVTPLIPQGRYTVTLRTGFYGFYFENIEERYPDVKSLLIAPEFYVDGNCDSGANRRSIG